MNSKKPIVEIELEDESSNLLSSEVKPTSHKRSISVGNPRDIPNLEQSNEQPQDGRGWLTKNANAVIGAIQKRISADSDSITPLVEIMKSKEFTEVKFPTATFIKQQNQVSSSPSLNVNENLASKLGPRYFNNKRKKAKHRILCKSTSNNKILNSGSITEESNGSISSVVDKEEARNLFLLRRYFMIRLAESLFVFGAPTFRIEHILKRTASELEITATFATLPSLLIMSFADPITLTTETIALPMSAGCDLDKLITVCRLCFKLGKCENTIEQGSCVLENLLSKPSRYKQWHTTVAAVITSMLIAPLSFNGSWGDMFASGVTSTLSQFLLYFATRKEYLRYIVDPFSAMVVGFVAVPFKRLFSEAICYPTIVLAGIMGQLPGLMLCTALVELTTGHMISGTTRLMTGLVRSLLLAFGLSVGYKIWGWFLDPVTHVVDKAFFTCDVSYSVSNSGYWIPLYIFLLPVMAFSLSVTLRAAPSQYLIMVITCTTAFWGGIILRSYHASSDFTSIVVSFLVGLISNLYSRFTSLPGIGPLLSGIILLVPGSMGVRSSLALIAKEDFGNGSNFAFQVILTSISLSLGILTARIVPPVDSFLHSKSPWSLAHDLYTKTSHLRKLIRVNIPTQNFTQHFSANKSS